MKSWSVVATFAACFFLQPTLAGIAALWGKGPDLLLCMTITAIFWGKNARFVTIASLITAAASDICFSLYAGPSAAGIFLASICASAAAAYCRWDRPAFFFMFVVFETILYQLILWLGMICLGAPRSFFHLIRIVPLAVLYNLAVMLVCRIVDGTLVWKGSIKGEKRREEL